MSLWYSLYLRYGQANGIPLELVNHLENTLNAAGFLRYDPFSLMPRLQTYARTVKLFVAPPQNGWIRLIVDTASVPPPTSLKPLPYLMLEARLTTYDKQLTAQFQMYQQGNVHPLTTTSAIEGIDLAALTQALALPSTDNAHAPRSGGLPYDALGGDVKSMADHINPQQAQSMFDKIAGKLLPDSQKDAANQFLGDSIDWQGAAGRKIAAVMACFPIPQWKLPDFVTLRNAYQLHIRHQRRPDAPLYPGDDEAMAACPNALDYVPVFAGVEA